MIMKQLLSMALKRIWVLLTCKVMDLYNKFYAWLQKRWKDEEVYPPTEQFKRKYISTLSGTVLEIGPGAGSNLRYLPKDIHWIGVEPNPPVIETLKAEAQAEG